MAGGKKQVVLLMDEAKRDRLDALRIVMQVSRARVGEQVFDHRSGLAGLERDHADGLRRVGALAERAKVSTPAYVQAYASAYARETYGPGLDGLEADDKRVRAELKRGTKSKG